LENDFALFAAEEIYGPSVPLLVAMATKHDGLIQLDLFAAATATIWLAFKPAAVWSM